MTLFINKKIHCYAVISFQFLNILAFSLLIISLHVHLRNGIPFDYISLIHCLVVAVVLGESHQRNSERFEIYNMILLL